MKGGKVNCYSNREENLCCGVNSNKMLYCFVRLNFNWISLSLNQAKSFQNAFCKCSRVLNIMFLNTSYFWWMSSFFSLSSQLKENSCHFVIQSEVKQKPKPIATDTTRSHTFSRAPRPLHASATSFDWFVGQPVGVLCDRRTSFNLQRSLFETKTTHIILLSSQ